MTTTQISDDDNRGVIREIEPTTSHHSVALFRIMFPKLAITQRASKQWSMRGVLKYGGMAECADVCVDEHAGEWIETNR